MPEDIELNATGAKPAPHPKETDAKLIREVWVRASSGEKPSLRCSKIGADTYRIWRLLAFWVEGGVLQPRPGAWWDRCSYTFGGGRASR